MPGAALIHDYLKDPPPGVVLVFDCSRYEFEGDDKAKLQRVEKFYSMIGSQVEFARHSPFGGAQDRRRNRAGEEPEDRRRRNSMRLWNCLAPMSRASPPRSKSFRCMPGPSAGSPKRTSSAWLPARRRRRSFALVNAIGRNDRTASLESLDVLVREGEYLALALSFLATQFRLALRRQGSPTDERLADSGVFHEAGNADVEIAGGAGRANRRSVLAREAADSGDENL